MCVCSGNHDLVWDDEAERWSPAAWLRDITNPRVWIDGERVTFGGFSLLNIGCATRPKGGESDFWVVHAPPCGTLVERRVDGVDHGDPDLVAAVRRYTPRVVFAGHIHAPMSWRDEVDSTLYLNPGFAPDALP